MMGIWERIRSWAQAFETGPVTMHLAALEHPSRMDIRDKAEEHLMGRARPNHVSDLLGRLSNLALDDDASERLARVIGYVANTDALGPLIEMVDHEDPFLQYRALLALAPMTRRLELDETLVTRLRKTILEIFNLYGLDQPIGLAAGKVLVALGMDQPLYNEVISLIADPDPENRREGWLLAGELGIPSARTLLETALESETDIDDRRTVRQALWLLDRPGATRDSYGDAIRDRIADLGASVAEFVATAQGELINHPEDSLPFLIEAISDAEPLVRVRSLICLAWMGQEASVDPLVELISESIVGSIKWSDEFLTGEAILALGRGGFPRVFDFLKDTAIEQWPNPLGLRAMEALTDLGDSRSIPVIMDLLMSEGPADACLGALARFNATSELKSLVKDPKFGERAARHLARIKN